MKYRITTRKQDRPPGVERLFEDLTEHLHEAALDKDFEGAGRLESHVDVEVWMNYFEDTLEAPPTAPDTFAINILLRPDGRPIRGDYQEALSYEVTLLLPRSVRIELSTANFYDDGEIRGQVIDAFNRYLDSLLADRETPRPDAAPLLEALEILASLLREVLEAREQLIRELLAAHVDLGEANARIELLEAQLRQAEATIHLGTEKTGFRHWGRLVAQGVLAAALPLSVAGIEAHATLEAAHIEAQAAQTPALVEPTQQAIQVLRLCDALEHGGSTP